MRTFGILLLCLLQYSCSSQIAGKINGISFVGSRDRAQQAHVDEILKVNANHAAVMPFGFIRDLSSPDIIFDTERQWYGETKKGAEQYIRLLVKNNVRVMLKPQIWIWRGEFTGGLKMNSEEDWKKLETSYDKFILTYARLAQEMGVDILCIGTELEQFVANRPTYWTGLIKRIRSVYKGKLTYAANWDEYKRTPFWDQLDYIGVDAYFPLSDAKTPTVEELKQGWKNWKTKMATLSQSTGKPILFTEFGYRSKDYTAKKPWLVDRNSQKVNLQAQVNAKMAIFEEFWNENWFAGGYVWKWFIHHSHAGGTEDNRFTPQNKPAQEVIQSFYRLY